jgi:cytochrome b6-f complex iron-sulfur subunit
MSTAAILAIVIPILVILAAVVLFTAARRRDSRGATGYLSRETRKRDRSDAALAEEEAGLSGRQYERSVAAEAGRGGALVVAEKAPPPTAYVPPDEETLGVTRRQFFNRSIVTLTVLSLSGFGAAVLAFLWPQVRGGFGATIGVGSVSDVQANIEAGGGFWYVPEGRAWLTSYPASALPEAEAVYPEPVLVGMREGIVALYQKCPHLGCRVPECPTSQWFECPCHGSQYNRAGEHKAGPAPRGMDRFGVGVDGDNVSVDTGSIFGGPPIGTNTTGQEAEGPHCVGAGGGH